jgi:hypothetical protein
MYLILVNHKNLFLVVSIRFLVVRLLVFMNELNHYQYRNKYVTGFLVMVYLLLGKMKELYISQGL